MVRVDATLVRAEVLQFVFPQLEERLEAWCKVVLALDRGGAMAQSSPAGKILRWRCFPERAHGCTLVPVRGWYAATGKMGSPPKIPPDISTTLRSLAHDLSNAIETIMQAGYLLGQAKLDDDTKKWVGLIDTASRDAARINRQIRDILRTHSE